MISGLCVPCLFPPCDLLFHLPQACSVKPESSVFSVRCLFIFGSCQCVTIECISSFNTKLQPMYPVQVLGGAARCCKILQRLLPRLLVMQFCFEEVLGEKKLYSHIFCCLTATLRIVLFSVPGDSTFRILKRALPLSPFLRRTSPMRLY